MSEPADQSSTAEALAEVAAAVEKLQATEAPPAVVLTAAQALEAWLNTYIRNTAYARDTRVWNSVFNGVSQIKAALSLSDLT